MVGRGRHRHRRHHSSPGAGGESRSGGAGPERRIGSASRLEFAGGHGGCGSRVPASRPAPPGGCWRVQIAAPVKRAEAEKKRAAAESLLLLPVVVEHEAGLWKIRTRDCFERSVADGIRTRAKGSGFAGAFPFQAKR